MWESYVGFHLTRKCRGCRVTLWPNSEQLPVVLNGYKINFVNFAGSLRGVKKQLFSLGIKEI